MKAKPIVQALLGAALIAVIIWVAAGYVSRPDVIKLWQNEDIEGLIRALEYEDNPVLAFAGLGKEGGGEYAVAYQDIVRAKAAFYLGKIGDARAVEPLSQILSYEEVSSGKQPREQEKTRQNAAIALGRIGDTRAVEPLIQALGDPKSEVRLSAVRALGEIGDTRAVESLIQALGDPKSEVRLSAVRALGKIGDARAVGPLIEFHSRTGEEAARAALVTIGGEAAIKYFIQVGDLDDMAKMGEAAVEPLIQVLESGEVSMRRSAAYALGEIGDPRAEKALGAAMTDLNIRETAANALVKMYWDDVTKLLGYLQYEYAAVLLYPRLIEMGKPGTEDALIEALARFGNEEMATVYLNCENKRLEEAARKWAAAHGYTIWSSPGIGGGTRWGGP
jgi:HEAT repeat protein